MKITFIRHGLSESNKRRIVAGSSNADLSPEGIEELYELKKVLPYPKADLYISSPLTRAVDTFGILYENEKLHRIDEHFKELNFGEIEGLSYEESNLDEFFTKFLNNEKHKGGELYDDFYNRLTKGLTKLIEELKENNLNSAVIVAHSIVIKTIVLNAYNMSKEEFRTIELRNGYGYMVDVDLVDGKIVYNTCEAIM